MAILHLLNSRDFFACRACGAARSVFQTSLGAWLRIWLALEKVQERKLPE
jgi:hypothetical protein